VPSSFYAIHPRPGRTFHIPFFVAHGRWLGTPAPLRGVLYDGNGEPVAVGRLVRNDRRFWVMVFTAVPQGAGYRLHLKNPANGEVLDVEGLTVAPPGYSISIAYPLESDMPVGTTFITYGTTDETSALTADLTPSGDETVTYLWGPPDNPTYWAFQFDEVSVGSYTLSVRCGTSSVATESIDVM
jgi:hypothetical protein